MKKNLFIILTVIMVVSGYTINVSAAFKDAGWGARPSGIGGAFTGVADSSDAPLWNPAGIGQMSNAEISFMYAPYYTGLELKAGKDKDTVSIGFNYLSFVYPKSKIGILGLGWANFTATNLYKEDTYVFTYAKKINDFFPNLPPRIYVGVNLKSLSHTYEIDEYAKIDPVFASGDSKSAVTMDIGALVRPFREKPLSRINIGFAAKNVTQPDIGLKDEDIVPMELRAGVAYRWVKLTPAFDIMMRNGETRFYAGMESWLMNQTLGLRAGFNETETALGLSFYGLKGKTLGFNFDYTFIIPMQLEDAGSSHRVSMGLWF